jgi:hypothetical protein
MVSLYWIGTCWRDSNENDMGVCVGINVCVGVDL